MHSRDITTKLAEQGPAGAGGGGARGIGVARVRAEGIRRLYTVDPESLR